jgi:hypothetical protein
MEKKKRTTKKELVTERPSEYVSETQQEGAEAICFSDEGDDEGVRANNDLELNAYFLVHDGREQLRVKAYVNYWALQYLSPMKNKITGIENPTWKDFKFFANLGQLANRIFDWRLKNSETTTLKELEQNAKRIGDEIREEFSVKLQTVKVPKKCSIK